MSTPVVVGIIVLVVFMVLRVGMLAGRQAEEAKKLHEELGYNWPNVRPRSGDCGYVKIHICNKCGARGSHWDHMFMPYSDPCKFCGHIGRYSSSAKWTYFLQCWETPREAEARKNPPESEASLEHPESS